MLHAPRRRMQRAGTLAAAACGLALAAGCGGDDTETTTVTTTTQTAQDVVEDCTSKSAPNVTDLSVRNMSCEEADDLAGDVIGSLSRKPFTAAGFDCEILGGSAPDSGTILGAENIRCISGDRAFRFSWGD